MDTISPLPADATPPVFTSPPPPPSTPASPTPPPPPPHMPQLTPVTKPRKSRGWMIVALILLLLLGVSILFNFGQLFSGLTHLSASGHQSAGPRLQETLLEDNGSANKIAVVAIEGVITGSAIDGTGFTMVEVIKAQLDRAEEDRRVKAVILRVDSPGGEVLASDEIAAALREFQESSGKPVIASMGNLAASGGYYVSAPCRWIVANELTITGSIGVIMSGLNYRGLMDKIGLEPQVYKSGQFKDMLSGARKPGEVTEEERKMVQDLIDEVYGKFTNVVAAGRAEAHEQNSDEGRALVGDWSKFADGRVFSGSDAFKYGFVDELGNFEVAVERALDLADESEADVIEYKRIVDFADIFRMFGETESRAVKLDLGIETPKLKAGQPYFLSPLHVYGHQ